MYFVHSFRVLESDENKSWTLATTDYGGEFVSAIKKGEVRASLGPLEWVGQLRDKMKMIWELKVERQLDCLCEQRGLVATSQ